MKVKTNTKAGSALWAAKLRASETIRTQVRSDRAGKNSEARAIHESQDEHQGRQRTVGQLILITRQVLAMKQGCSES